MKNLVLKSARRECSAYIPLKEPVGRYKTLEISVLYVLGGPNYFSGEYNKRGYRISLRPCNIANGFQESTMLGTGRESGGYIMIKEAPRYSQKVLLEIAEKIDPLVQDVAETWRVDGPFLKMILDTFNL